jgi:fimbrial chaperone protein
MSIAGGTRLGNALLPWALAGLISWGGAGTAVAGGFYVVPTALDLGKGAQSGTFSVVNSGDEKLDVKVSVQSWAQSADGKDLYADTTELVFFPKIMTVEAHDQRAIRVGVKGPPPGREKAFRIFVEEIPRPGGAVTRIEQGNVSGAIALAYRFSIPIFWRPPKAQGGGALGSIEMKRGEARAVVTNAGNTHLKMPSVTFRGKGGDGREVFLQEMNGWYVLQGMSRTYAVTVPPELCRALTVIEVKARMEKGEFDGILNVAKEMCSP